MITPILTVTYLYGFLYSFAGLFVKVDNGKEYYFDIAQAPLEFINDQLCLKGKITFKMPDVKQRRIYCYFLKQNDNLKNVIERIQNLPEVIILILANFSSSVFLDKSFVDDLHVANLKVTLPVYVISSETGQELQKQDKEGKELFCTLPPIKCKVQTSCTGRLNIWLLSALIIIIYVMWEERVQMWLHTDSSGYPIRKV